MWSVSNYEILLLTSLILKVLGFKATSCIAGVVAVSAMAARVIAQLIVVGSGMMIRAFAQAYRQALSNASKTGAAQEVAQNIQRAGKAITESEARQVLGVAENSSWEEIMQKYDNLFEQNAKNGSFYLQSKVHRAKECLEAVYQSKSEGTN
ncbi:PREDICTED: mitochondrial import inner membrane translocase subunit PAM16 like 2-like isoform X1 [Ipomoea nil]|uniref:mitochondrial import inner membrane translocase subunit PAM16 like 2-like isoform X1 n=2 Tax=Ipomoea nil TaxID=35883 RepID=UPI000901D82C|nr:PREDICTED: mitochondrial import inner membrane translocase subunit PAM16 like 2-like isoform X1 [Ipomoea nil]